MEKENKFNLSENSQVRTSRENESDVSSLNSNDKLSVVIITHDEEKNIERCLQAVLPVADEIIVVDSYSTDHTEEICKKFDVRFFRHAWEDYSSQKNYANSLAKYKYILSLDADEALSTELGNSISEEKKHGFIYDCYEFNRLTYFCGKPIKHCGWYPDKKIRIWNKTKAQWQGVLHETLQFTSTPKKRNLNGDLLHYSYYSIKGHIDQINSFSETAAIEAVKRGKKSNLLHIFLNPLWKFISSYFLHLGFLDGFPGLVVCLNSSFAKYLKYLKIKQYSEM